MLDLLDEGFLHQKILLLLFQPFGITGSKTNSDFPKVLAQLPLLAILIFMFIPLSQVASLGPVVSHYL